MFVRQIHVKIMDNARLLAEVVVQPLTVFVHLALKEIDVKHVRMFLL
jgi:hypothetical protein